MLDVLTLQGFKSCFSCKINILIFDFRRVIAKLDASLYFSKVYGQCPQSGKSISLVLGEPPSHFGNLELPPKVAKESP